jgi:hypothetical protein
MSSEYYQEYLSKSRFLGTKILLEMSTALLEKKLYLRVMGQQ